MTASQAAQALLESLNLPAGSIAVWPLKRHGTTILVVRVQGRRAIALSVPSSFAGFPVLLEEGGPIPSQRNVVGSGPSQLLFRG